MHALVFVIGDKVQEQLRSQMREHIDFYVIGGRWSGFLPKRNADGTIENVDSLRVGEIAWDETLAELEQSARQAFAQWWEICERHGRPKSRLEIARELGLDRTELGHYPEEVYTIYRDQPALLAYDEAHPDNIYCPIKQFGFDEKKYVNDVLASRFAPFALVIGGKWHEGPIGLDDPEPEWSETVRDRLRSLPPETQVTAVDCHM